MHGNVNVQLRTLLKAQYLATDVLPILDFIITPEFKSLNNIKDYDQKRLHEAINALEGFGLRIVNGKDEGYNEIFTTYPQFNSITKFDALSTKKQNQKRTQLFPVIQKEIDSLKVKKRAFSKIDQEGEESTTRGDFAVLKNQYEKIAEAEQKAKKRKTEVKIWVKYHEGFSNAVRKPVKWNSLWN